MACVAGWFFFWWLWWRFTMGSKCDWDFPRWNPTSDARCNTPQKDILNAVASYDDEDQVSQNYLLYRCPLVECLSIMNATWSFPGSETSNPVTQEMLLIKMVRHHHSDSSLASQWSDARERCHANTARETGNHVCKLSMWKLYLWAMRTRVWYRSSGNNGYCYSSYR
jgi:hypothetical protein